GITKGQKQESPGFTERFRSVPILAYQSTTPYGSRTPVLWLRTRYPGPLDEGGVGPTDRKIIRALRQQVKLLSFRPAHSADAADFRIAFQFSSAAWCYRRYRYVPPAPPPEIISPYSS